MVDEPVRQRLGVFGGSFDPIHIGHLLIAEQAREQLGLSQVRFIPASTAPHKLDRQTAEAKHRVEMLRLAIGGNQHFLLDERELKRGGTSFTVDTLGELKQELPDAELVFLMGADSLADFHTWRNPSKICELSFVAIVARGGRPLPDLQQLSVYLPEQQRSDLSSHLVNMPQLEISSTEIRARVIAGKSIRYMVPAAVEAYLAHHAVYS